MKIYKALYQLIGQGIKLGNTISENELDERKEYVFSGAGILQRGYCNRDLNNPDGYDKFFDSLEECENYISDIERCGYGNTISGPYLLYTEIIR